MRVLVAFRKPSMLVIPAEQAGLHPASESRNPVISAIRAFTSAVAGAPNASVFWPPPPAHPEIPKPAEE